MREFKVIGGFVMNKEAFELDERLRRKLEGGRYEPQS